MIFGFVQSIDNLDSLYSLQSSCLSPIGTITALFSQGAFTNVFTFSISIKQLTMATPNQPLLHGIHSLFKSVFFDKVGLRLPEFGVVTIETNEFVMRTFFDNSSLV